MFDRAIEEAMCEAMVQEPEFKVGRKGVRKRIEKTYRIVLRRGRTATRLTAAKNALRMKEENPRLSLMQITRKVCQCGKEQHDHQCRENLRQGIIKLKKQTKE